jgi:HPt (histidine-containing phosphotransfer) domain-containing protein
MTQPSDKPQSPVTSAIARVWQRVQGVILERVTVLEQAARSLLERTLSDELRQRAEQEAHKLAGSLGTFGFLQGSHLAREIEKILQGDVIANDAQAKRLADLTAALRRELEQP